MRALFPYSGHQYQLCRLVLLTGHIQTVGSLSLTRARSSVKYLDVSGFGTLIYIHRYGFRDGICTTPAPGECTSLRMRLFLFFVLCSGESSFEKMTRFKCSGAFSDIYLGLSNKYFICALHVLAKTTFKSLFCGSKA